MAVAVVCVLVLGYVIDAQLRDRELHRLLDRIEQAQATATYADNRVAAIAQYTSPQRTSPAAPASVRRGLERLVEDTAAEQVQAVQGALSKADTWTLPWHGNVRVARDRYRSYAAHRLSLLRAGGRDINVLRTPHPELAVELSRVRAALSAAGASDRQVLAAVGSH